MNFRPSNLMMFMLFCALALIGVVQGVTFAAQKKPSDHDLSMLSQKGHKASVGASQRVVVTKGMSPAKANGDAEVPSKAAVALPVKPLPKANRRAINVHKKVLPKATVQPRTDLMYYGILEDSQRYDPRPSPHSAGVPNPQASDLTQDHFQELDRNQDGRIDPVERAFGRLDMDRDLQNRHLQ